MKEILRKMVGKGIHFTCITTKKFKTSCLSINLILPLGQVDPALYAVLPRVLRRGTAQYPDRDRLGIRLDSLYGARIEPVVRRRGEALCVGLISDVIDEAYAGGEKLVLETAQLMGQMLLTPYREAGAFSSAYVHGERENLMDEIRAKINDKKSYALFRLYEIMCAGEAYGKDILGTLEQAAAITPERLEGAYSRMLKTAEIQLFYCGTQPAQAVETAFLSALASLERGEIMPVTTQVIRQAGPLKEVTEEMDTVQGKLSMGFRTGITAEEPGYPAFMLFNCAFGGSTSSKLFLNVREKKSLCYYASSTSDKLKGLMVVASGIENRNFQVTREEILHQLAEMQNGNLTPEELVSAQRTLIYAFQAAEDSPVALEGYYLTNGSSPAGAAGYGILFEGRRRPWKYVNGSMPLWRKKWSRSPWQTAFPSPIFPNRILPKPMPSLPPISVRWIPALLWKGRRSAPRTALLTFWSIRCLRTQTAMLCRSLLGPALPQTPIQAMV